ncbi:MAG: hypothetical protein ABI693_11815, partial [Bryobacteraceae bacterium]
MNRRTFAKLAGLSCVTPAALALSDGITGVTRNLLVLTSPPDRPPEGTLRYALAFPFQADSRTMGVMVMRMTEETPNYGFLDGSDVVLIDDFQKPGRTFAASRNETTDGRLFMKSPMLGGFVPRGALRADATPHPHAGTGFGIGQAHWFPFPDRRFSWRDPARQDMNEVYQLSYDGQSFKAVRNDVRAQNGDDPLRIGKSGWTVLVSGIKNAIPDGHDLLLSALAAREDRSAVAVGVIRWARQSGFWKPIDFDPVVTTPGPVPKGPNPMERCPWMEPSVDRDADGRLLFSARGMDVPKGPGYTLRLWRTDGQGGWRQLLDEPKARLNSPVTVNVAPNGSAYIVSNP